MAQSDYENRVRVTVTQAICLDLLHDLANEVTGSSRTDLLSAVERLTTRYQLKNGIKPPPGKVEAVILHNRAVAGRYLLHVFDTQGQRRSSHHCDGTYDSMSLLIDAARGAIGDERVGIVTLLDKENMPTKNDGLGGLEPDTVLTTPKNIQQMLSSSVAHAARAQSATIDAIGLLNDIQEALKTQPAVVLRVADVSRVKDGLDPMVTQKTEFDAMYALGQAYDNLPAIVDDNYPRARHQYDIALRTFLRACADNGRLIPAV